MLKVSSINSATQNTSNSSAQQVNSEEVSSGSIMTENTPASSTQKSDQTNGEQTNGEEKLSETGKRIQKYRDKGVSILNTDGNFDTDRILLGAVSITNKDLPLEKYYDSLEKLDETVDEGIITSQTFSSNGDSYVINYVYNHNNERITYPKVLTGVTVEACNSEEKTATEYMSIADYGKIEENEITEYESGKISTVVKSGYNSSGDEIYTEAYEFNWNETGVNGIIEDFEQKTNTYLCWMLSGLNAFSNSDTGLKVINEAVTQNPDGSCSVYFKGLDYTVTLSKDEIMEAANSGQYVSEDSDIDVSGVFIPAFKKALEYAEENNIYTGARKNVQREDILDVRNFNTFVFMLTGNEAVGSNLTNEGIDARLDMLKDDKESIALTSGFLLPDNKPTKAVDINGEEFNVLPGHLYSVSDATDDTVTLVNTEGSVYTISRDVYFSLNPSIEYYSLKDSRVHI